MQRDSRSNADNLKAFVENIEALAEVPGELASKLLTVARLETFVKDEEIYLDASEGRDYFFVPEGCIEATRQTPLGVQTVARLKAGDQFP